MGCRITDKWTYRGFRTIILENSMLRATLLPESGAKLWEFIYKPADRELLWHNPRIEPRPPVFYGDADAWWCGGLDECIPTGHPCNLQGRQLPLPRRNMDAALGIRTDGAGRGTRWRAPLAALRP